MQGIQFSKTSSQVILPEGGLNTETSKLAIPPGQMIGCSNVEIGEPKGWRRSDGYERFDGHPRPHLAEYTAYEATFSNEAVSGAEFTGPTGSGIILDDYESDSEVIWLYVAVGTVAATDILTVAAVNICTLDVLTAAETIEDTKTYTDRAVTAARSYIGEVTGTGDINGVWSYKGNVYAFRDGIMYESSSAGWVVVVFPSEIEFDTGSAVTSSDIPAVGDTVTNGTATADVVGIQKTNAAADGWTDNLAIGVITVSNITGGTFADTDTLTFAGTGAGATAVATTDQTQIVLNTDGRYEFKNYNFSGSADTLNMYGVDGANYMFSFDGTTYLQIRTGLEDDTPSHIFMMNFQAFVSKLGSWLLSPLGDVFGTWENVRGSDEWAMGDTIVGAITSPGGTALSFARNSISIIYPTDSGYYAIKPYASDYGALEWSLQNAVAPICISDGGVTLIQPTDKFGDFEAGQADEVIRDLISGLKESFVTSVVFRNKKEYRMFFSNGTTVRLKFGINSVVGFSVDEYPLTVRGCTASVRSDRFLTDTTVEKDHVFFYSDNGYIYQMDAGDSFDGDDIVAFYALPWNHMGSPRMKKRWYDVILEIETKDSGVMIGVKPVYDMYSPERTDVNETNVQVDLPGGIWGEVNWDEFYWSESPTGGMYKIRLRSTTPGLGLVIGSVGGASWNVRSITTRFSGRGEVR